MEIDPINNDIVDAPPLPDVPIPAPEQGENWPQPVHHSGRHQEVPYRLGNIYGEKQTPTEILRDTEH